MTKKQKVIFVLAAVIPVFGAYFIGMNHGSRLAAAQPCLPWTEKDGQIYIDVSGITLEQIKRKNWTPDPNCPCKGPNDVGLGCPCPNQEFEIIEESHPALDLQAELDRLNKLDQNSPVK